MRELNFEEVHQIQGGANAGALLGLFSGITTGFGICALFLATQPVLTQVAAITGCTVFTIILGII